ncbi:hypothetical protein PHYBOEH_001782 [Phytophthora boehmeriae]|uniref:Uncharacterized protein n=1 Tax=Phytophthora boehmeriae TaxID=109152 RepID=A0A8T1X6G7_9STRA|nr:hypothetical protein PHYBOEH_001782 [Phytophthora boehmeriae]
MYSNDARHLRDAAAVDLSFSQILEARSSIHEQQRRRRKPPVAVGRLARGSGPQQRRPPPPPSDSPSSFLESEDAGPPAYGGSMLDSVYEGSEDILEENGSGMEDSKSFSRGLDSSTDDEDWTSAGDGQIGQDMYRFVQPRRLSSWVQDDAVFACFKCHTVFSLLEIMKRHQWRQRIIRCRQMQVT